MSTTTTYRVVLWLDPFHVRGGPLALGAYVWGPYPGSPMTWVPREGPGIGVSIAEADERFLEIILRRLAHDLRDSGRWEPGEISAELGWGPPKRIPLRPELWEIQRYKWAEWLEKNIDFRGGRVPVGRG